MKQEIKTVMEIWDSFTSRDRENLIDKYGASKGILPYYHKKPNKREIIIVLTAAWEDNYLIIPFKELPTPSYAWWNNLNPIERDAMCAKYHPLNRWQQMGGKEIQSIYEAEINSKKFSDLMADVDPNEGWEKEEQPSPSSTVERTKGEFDYWPTTDGWEIGLKHLRIAKTLPVDNIHMGSVEEANAAYICKAVNSHEELVRALSLVKQLVDICADTPLYESGLHSERLAVYQTLKKSEAYKMVVTALQKASQ